MKEQKDCYKTILLPKYNLTLEKYVVNEDLQINNSLVSRGIYLVEYENSVFWGYDAELYEYLEDGNVSRKDGYSVNQSKD